MANEEQAQAEEQVQVEEARSSNDLAELREMLEKQKAEIAGLNRVIFEGDKQRQELEQEAEQAKRSKMSELEKLRADFEASEARRLESERQAKIERNRSFAKDLLREEGLPADALELLDVTDADTLAASFEKVKSMTSKVKETVAEQFASKYGHQAPKTGEGDAVKPPASLKAAKTKEEKIAYLKSMRN